MSGGDFFPSARRALMDALVTNGNAGFSVPQKALDALREAGYVVTCADCGSSTDGIHYVGCHLDNPFKRQP